MDEGDGDSPGVPGHKDGQEGFGKPRKDLELTGDGELLELGRLLGEVRLGLSVGGDSVTFADVSAGEL